MMEFTEIKNDTAYNREFDLPGYEMIMRSFVALSNIFLKEGVQ